MRQSLTATLSGLVLEETGMNFRRVETIISTHILFDKLDFLV